MYIIPKQVNLAIVPSQITPGAVVAAIFQNGHYLRNEEAQNLQFLLYIGFVRRRFQKKYSQMYHNILSDIVKAILQNGGHFQRNSLSQNLRGAEPPMLTLCIGFVGRRFQKKYCQIHHAIISAILEAIFQKMAAFFSK